MIAFSYYKIMKHIKTKIRLRNFQAFFIIFAVISQLSLIYGQKQIIKQSKKAIEAQNWLNRSDRLTSELKEDLFWLSDARKAEFLVQIAKLWWKEDNVEAKATLKKAISLVSVGDTDGEVIRNEKLAAARSLHKTIILFDKQSADKLLETIRSSEKSEQSSELNAQAILQSALTVIDADRQQAFQLGLMSLRYGVFKQTLVLIAQLSLRDESLAGKLAVQATNLAVQKNDTNWINLLNSLVFGAFKGQRLSDETQKIILEAAYNKTFTGLNAQSSCNSVLQELSLIVFYDKYFPDKAAVIRQKGISCRQGSQTATSDTISEKLGEIAPKTVDELISLARDSKNRDEKGKYYQKAINLLLESKQYLTILTLMDDIPEDDRISLGDFGDESVWERLRRDYAYLACLILLKEDNLSAVGTIVNNTPENLRPILQNELATELIKSKNNLYAFELLQAVRKNISKVKNRNLAAETYLKLFRTYITLQPDEVPVVFPELIKVINEADSFNSENNLPKFRSSELIISLPAELLEIDEAGAFNSIESLSSSESKTRLRLGLLESSLKKYKEKSDALRNNKQAAKS